MRKKWPITLLALLLTICLIGSLSVGAATACPQMPKGAENLFKPDTMKILGDNLLAFYENDTFLADSRGGIDPNVGKMVASFDFNATMKKDYVISFWARLAGDTDQYILRIMDDGEGSYCEVEFSGAQARIFSSVGTIDRYTLPSTGKCLAATSDTILGEWKNVSIYIRPNGNTTDISLFVDGEAMTCNGSDTSTVDTSDRTLMFGNSAPLMMRGIRVYEVNPKATAFETPFDPDAEFTVDAEDGIDGDNGGTGAVLITSTTAPASDGALGQVGGSSADLGLILGIAGGAIVVIAGAVVVILLILKKKKAASPTDATEKEGNDDENA